jgi:hypothetical protein
MLLETNSIPNNTVTTFKLVNGDEIVARVVESTPTKYKLSKPTTVIPGPQGIALVQSVFSMDTDADVWLDQQHVMFCCKTDDRMINHYIQTVTGIQTVPAGSRLVV